MSQKDDILDELSGLNSSLGTSGLNPYQVPVNYFEGLADQVMRRIKALDAGNAKEEIAFLSPYLDNISRNLPYSLPAGYFEELDPSFVTIDTDRELEAISPLISGLKKEMPFSVPDGYFEKLREPVAKKQTSRIVSFGWVRYAAAAVVTGLIVLAAFMFRSNSEPGMKVFAKVTKDIKKMNEVQKDNLLDFIEAGLNGNESVTVSADTKSEIRSLIQGVPENELKDFEEQTEDIQDVLMTN